VAAGLQRHGGGQHAHGEQSPAQADQGHAAAEQQGRAQRLGKDGREKATMPTIAPVAARR
jgi:hypothetical protein